MTLQRASTFYKWGYGLLSEFIKGASHVGMVTLSGTGIAQMIENGTPAITAPPTAPLTFHYFLLVLAIGGGLKALAYLDTQPLPPMDFGVDDTAADAAADRKIVQSSTPNPQAVTSPNSNP